MKVASSPMSAIEALQLDAAYVAVAKSLELPCQSYMALSDGPILDAQAGAETFGSALIAALAGVNSVSGPGMLDFLLVFSLPKLVFDDEMCGQALRFVREVKPHDDLPVDALIDQLMADQHLIMADHTMAHWPTRAVPAVRDRRSRQPRELAQGRAPRTRTSGRSTRSTGGSPPTGQLATDPAVDAELRRIITSGLESQTELPYIPPAAEPSEEARAGAASGNGAGRGRRVNARRRAG